MRRDSTAYSAGTADAHSSTRAAFRARLGGISRRALAQLAAALLLGALLITLAYQIPVTHIVDIGGYDAAYVQGFYDPERAGAGQSSAELAGSDGSARWTRDIADLLLPQAGLPAQVTLRLRSADNTAPEVTVLLNGAQELGRFRASPTWQEHTFAISGGILKPNDVVIEIRSASAPHTPNDPRRVGVLLDRAVYRAGPAPLLPYPPQLAYGALAAGMLWLLIYRGGKQKAEGEHQTAFRLPSPTLRPGFAWLIAVVGLSLAFLLLYRAQPLYPYPLLRLLPAIDALLAALLALRYAGALARRPVLLDTLALGGVAAWGVAVLLAAQSHLTLSVPGVEKDFRVFALRSAHLAGSFPAGTADPALDGVLRADGFYNLGYPLLLWLARPLAADNPFIAGRLVAALAGTLLLLSGWLLARRLLGSGPALLALLLLALSPLVVQSALTLGTDMPFAALCALTLALLVPSVGSQPTNPAALPRPGSPPAEQLGRFAPFILHALCALAGLAAGAAFLMRHPGLLLLPFGWLAIWQNNRTSTAKLSAQSSKLLVIFSLAFTITMLPQVYVNLRDTGAPLYSQQAKNVWQAVFGDGNWGRWAEAHNDIGIAQVIAQNPARFAQNWWNNLRGFVGTGGEDTREFGQALQLRLLGFPANWLALAGLLGWLLAERKRYKEQGKHTEAFTVHLSPFACLWAWIALYVAAISVGLPLQGRFALPLAPIYAAAAAWLVTQIGQREPPAPSNHFVNMPSHQAASNFVPSVANDIRSAPALLVGLALLALGSGGFTTGAAQVLRSRPANEPAIARAEGRAELPGQPADEQAIIALALAHMRPGERVIVRAAPGVPIAKYSALAHLAQTAPADDSPAALNASGATYLIWSATLGNAPGLGPPLASAGSYQLYRLSQ